MSVLGNLKPKRKTLLPATHRIGIPITMRIVYIVFWVTTISPNCTGSVMNRVMAANPCKTRESVLVPVETKAKRTHSNEETDRDEQERVCQERVDREKED
jgi:hypothetical protein